MKKVFIYDYKRSPIGSHAGVLSSIRPDDLLTEVIQKLPRLKETQIEEIITGCANQAGEDNRNVARMVSLLSGLNCPGNTVNRLCASGLQAVGDAFCQIKSGIKDVILASGVESMTRSPYVMAKVDKAFKYQNPTVFDTTLGWRFTNPKLAKLHHPYSMGETAENLVTKFKISREAQDEFALNSQKKYQENLKFIEQEIVAVTSAAGPVQKDEHPKPATTLEKLSTLKPAFKEGGSVTAGNSSGLNDGAAAVIVGAEGTLQNPLAEILDWTSAAVDPAIMGIGPVEAIQKLLKRNSLSLKDISFLEINEAFAAQVLACCEGLALDSKLVNPHGGAIAVGHPLGMSGVRLAGRASLWCSQNPGRYAVVSLCVGVGQGMAMLLKK